MVSVAVTFAHWLFAISLGLLAYEYVGYLLFIAAVAAFCRSRKRELGYTPSISILIAAYNEEADIRQKLEQTLALDYPPDRLEIVVVSDSSSDRTDEIVRAFDDPRVTLIRAPERKGKTNAQNIGVLHCRGEIVVFSDATTVYHPQALAYLATPYGDGDVGAVSGRYQYFDPSGKSTTGLGSIAFWNYENLIKLFQSRIKSLTGCSGCIYSVRRSLYTPLPADALSDVLQALSVLRQGYRVAFEERALAYEETTRNTKDEFRMRVRVVSRGMAAIVSVRELLNFRRYGWISFQLLSHKVLRWLVPLYLIALFLSSAMLAQSPVFRAIFLLQVAFYLLAAIPLVTPVHHRLKLLAIPLYFCTVNLAALLGLLNLFRRRTFTVWQTVR
jgi:cellulose synthase/poly-beta-1,6-N-acetylglucosamine synthase-like glycosyltransferase